MIQDYQTHSFSEAPAQPSVIQDLHRLTEELRFQVDSLIERLAPVLSPHYGSEVTADAPEPVKSPVRSIHDGIERERRRLGALCDALEL